VSMKSGDPYEVVAFTTAARYGYDRGYPSARREAPPEAIPGLSVHPLSPRQRLDDVLTYTRELSVYMGGTDCALPMIYADSASREIDVFEVFTDSETWAGSVHPAEALRSYRRNHESDAKLIVHGMVSNGFTIADPEDAGMMDVVGFDAAVPSLTDAFVRGEL
jgi:60 kDa SS-A/Ro ribonucleoprotein